MMMIYRMSSAAISRLHRASNALDATREKAFRHR